MNYFEIFQLPLTLQVDLALLKRRFEELGGNQSDNARDSGEDAENQPREKPSQLVHAYRILQNEDATIRYVLQLKGLMQDEEVYVPDPQFTLEVMDINEELVELEMDENKEQLMNVEQKANRVLLKLYDDVAPIIENYKEDTGTEEELLQVKEFYQRKKYLQGILDRIKGIRNIASPQ